MSNPERIDRRRARQARVVGTMVAAVALGLLPPDVRGQTDPWSAPDVFEVAGIRVVHQPVAGHGLVAVRLHLLGGVRRVTPENAGAEPLLLMASGLGTEGFPAEEARIAEMKSGSDFFVSPGPDWTVIGFDGPARSFERSWTLLADRVVRPTLDSAAVAVARRQMIHDLSTAGDDPDEAVRRLARATAFEGHPYAVPARGTEATLTALDGEALRGFHQREMVRSRMVLVVVGGVERPVLESAVREGLGALPAGDYVWTAPESWGADDPGFRAEARAIPTNYIMGYFVGPPAGHEDYYPFQVAVDILGGIVASSLRARGFTYAASAHFVDRAAPGGAIYVSTEIPEASLEMVNEIIDAIRQGAGALRRDMLEDAAEDAVLAYWGQNETASGRASWLGRTLLLDGEIVDAEGYVDRWRQVGAGDIRRAAQRYFNDIRYGYLGDVAEVPEAELTRW